MFKRILVANRGEIACRVMRTARRMGVETVAVYSTPDANAQHVKMADAAIHVGSAPSADSYLRTDRILEAALATGAEAIHPGYGFLSENAGFADSVRAAGLTFIGPSGQSMRDMGAKDASKRLMEKAGVPLLPGYHGEAQDWETLEREAGACGLDDGKPVLLKAVLGGGGKGMRIVESKAELKDAVDGARREALASFGDDRLLVERYLPSARHIEVQVFCDRHGGANYLFERDCSLQRRHQKVIEEAPAPGVSDALRKSLGEAAVRAAQAVQYEGAGTVEFIADAADPTHFYFMEMNTRLQVEHPITEMVTGVDLVEWQLLIAAGHPLPIPQEQLTLSGHSFEARIYAENPECGFLPGSGSLTHLRTPEAFGEPYVGPELRASAQGHSVRLDTGVGEGDDISVFYDPMIAKLIVRGANRDAALQLMRRALGQWETVGLPTNVPFLQRVCDTPEFAAADVHTAFIQQHAAKLLPDAPPPPTPRALKLAALYWLSSQADALAASSMGDRPSSPWAAYPFARLGGGLCGGAGASPLRLQPLGFDGAPSGDAALVGLRRTSLSPGVLASYEMSLRRAAADGDAAAAASGEAEEETWAEVSLYERGAEGERSFRASVDGASVRGTAYLEAEADGMDGVAGCGATLSLFVEGEMVRLQVSDVAQQARQRLSAAAQGAGAAAASVVSPMPGKIVRVLASAGQAVAAGEPLVVLEAMKMEHTLKAPADVTIKAVHAAEGDVVGQRVVLLSFEEDSESAAEGAAAAAA